MYDYQNTFVENRQDELVAGAAGGVSTPDAHTCSAL